MVRNPIFHVFLMFISSISFATDEAVDPSLISWSSEGIQLHGDKTDGFKANMVAGSGWSEITDGSVRTFTRTNTKDDKVTEDKYIVNWTADQASQFGYSQNQKTAGAITSRFFAVSDANTYYGKCTENIDGQNDKSLSFSVLAKTNCEIVSPEYCQVLKAKFGKMKASDFKKCEDLFNTLQKAKVETTNKYLSQVYSALDMFPSQGKMTKKSNGERPANQDPNSDSRATPPIRTASNNLTLYGDIENCAELSRLRGGSERILTPTQRRDAYLKTLKNRTSQ